VPKFVLPPIEEKVGAFSRECYRALESRPDNFITCTVEQINIRYQKYCGSCPHFDGIICKEFGCSNNAQAKSRYFTLLLDPRTKCPYLDFGFPSFCSGDD
jgi:hypothetical protein